MRILIVDDEKPARGELRYLLQQFESGADLLEARSADVAWELLGRERVDVVFLDIQMPGRSGLVLAAEIVELPDPPLIVFATAYDVHAVRAFELAALDYVVKPFSEPRLAQTIVRVRQALAQRDLLAQRRDAVRTYVRQAAAQAAGAAGAPDGAGMPANAPQPAQPAPLPRLWVERENGNGVLVDYAAILWVEAEDKHVYVKTAAGERLAVRATLRELEERLLSHHIVRTHKAYLVNLQHVVEVVPWVAAGTYLLRLDDGSEAPLSRQYARVLKQLST
jgi:DNA-binding LytR/AlgR family response regulator